MEYQTILSNINALTSAFDASTLWTKYCEMHMSIERLMLDQGRTYPVDTNNVTGSRLHASNRMSSRNTTTGGAHQHNNPIVSMRNRWVGKSDHPSSSFFFFGEEGMTSEGSDAREWNQRIIDDDPLSLKAGQLLCQVRRHV